MSQQQQPAARSYWVWVTRPEYYLDEDGQDRRQLDPSRGYEHDGWWTCHKNTTRGDLVLLYRSRLRKDIAYLLEARSDAYPADDEDVEHGWTHFCDYEVIDKFSQPLSLAAMKADPDLREWGAVRANFQQKAYTIPPSIWAHLLTRLNVDRRLIERRRPVRSERRRRTRPVRRLRAQPQSSRGRRRASLRQ